MRAEASDLDRLIAGIRGCRHCVETPSGKSLPHEPRPVLRVSETARLAVCSQAPGTRVHASGIPFTDPSGDRLRDWMGVSAQEFYDQARIAIIAMGFCFPGQDENGGDLPPRAECSKLWHKPCSTTCRSSSLYWRSAPMLKLGISAPRRGQACRRPCSTGAGTCGGDANLAFCRFLTRHGATMRGSRAIRGSRKSCCRCCAVRSANSSKWAA